MSADATVNTSVHIRPGGDRLEVASGGSIVADSGSSITFAGTNTFSGTNSFTGSSSISGDTSVTTGKTLTVNSGGALTASAGSSVTLNGTVIYGTPADNSVTGTDTTVTLTAAASGQLQNINQATKLLKVNLPAASKSGWKIPVFFETSITNGSGNSVIFVAPGAYLFGSAWVISDNSAAVLGYAASGSTSVIFNGTTTGGIKGTMLEFEDVDTNVIRVKVMGAATGTEATPFG